MAMMISSNQKPPSMPLSQDEAPTMIPNFTDTTVEWTLSAVITWNWVRVERRSRVHFTSYVRVS